MNTLIERLRKRGTYADDGWGSLTSGGKWEGKPASFVIDPLCAEAATALTAADARIAELEALLSWQPIAAAPNGESILIMRDDWSMQVIHAEDNDYDWMPWDGEVGDGWLSPMLWFPAEGLVKAAEAAIAALNPGDPK